MIEILYCVTFIAAMVTLAGMVVVWTERPKPDRSQKDE